eukprot:EG_transcript_46416
MSLADSVVFDAVALKVRQLQRHADGLLAQSSRLGGPDDSPEFRRQVVRQQNEARQLAVELHSILGDLSLAAPGQQRLLDLATDYGAVLDQVQQAVHLTTEAMSEKKCGNSPRPAGWSLFGHCHALPGLG